MSAVTLRESSVEAGSPNPPSGASKSLVIECLLTLNRTKQQTNKHNPSPTLNLTFLFLSCQMQPVDLLGITIKTLAEIEKEVSSQPGTEQVMRAVFTSF